MPRFAAKPSTLYQQPDFIDRLAAADSPAGLAWPRPYLKRKTSA